MWWWLNHPVNTLKPTEFYTLNFLLFSHSVISNYVTPWTAAQQASLSFTISWSLLKLMSLELMMPSNHLTLCHPLFSCPQPLPASGSFPVSQLFPSGSQSVGVSASVLPMDIQDKFPLGWTGWITLQSKGLSRVFSNTTVQKHPFFTAQLSLQSNSHRGTKCYSPALTAIQNDTVQNDTVSIQSDTYVSKSSLKL